MYDNHNRRGDRTSTSVDPREIELDVDEKVYTLDPNCMPLQSIAKWGIGTGKKPTQQKLIVKQEHLFDNYDYCSAVAYGTAAGGSSPIFARLTLDQVSRPHTSGNMYYDPQDKFYIVATEQTVEVVITPQASMKINKAGTMFATADTTLTGATTTTSAAGTVVVQGIGKEPVKHFTNSWVIYIGRTIFESQDYEAPSKQRDYTYDCNFVEHKDTEFHMTRDQKEWIKNKSTVPDWTRQQEGLMKEFTTTVEMNMLFSKRHVDMSGDRPKYHTGGLIPSIRTNVAIYDPYTVSDFERMFSNFLFQQGFRYNPNGRNAKLAICGGRFLLNFNRAFGQFRHTPTIDPKGIGSIAGLDISTYVLPGGHKVILLRDEAFRMGTPMENWCCIIDPGLMELRLIEDYNSHYVANNNERDIKINIEWQGAMVYHLEQAHSLLKTAA